MQGLKLAKGGNIGVNMEAETEPLEKEILVEFPIIFGFQPLNFGGVTYDYKVCGSS